MQILAEGNSMYPTLVAGGKYNVILVKEEDIVVGDIIVFFINNIVICHRIIEIICFKNNKRFYKTQGDNCSEPDSSAVTFDMIIGKIRI